MGTDGSEQLGVAGEMAVGGVGGDAGAAGGLAKDDGCRAARAGELDAGGEESAMEIAMAKGGPRRSGRGRAGRGSLLRHRCLWTVYRLFA